MLLLALAAAAPFHAWGRFSRDPILAHRSEIVEIETRGVEGRQLRFVLRLTRKDLHGQEVRWTDSTRCPAIRPALAARPDLPPPRLAPPGSADEATTIVLDGIGYTLSMPAAFGAEGASVTMSSNSATPLAQWVDRTLAALAPCWADEPPKS